MFFPIRKKMHTYDYHVNDVDRDNDSKTREDVV